MKKKKELEVTPLPVYHTFRDSDRWISQLLECKPLSEKEVEQLCDKVNSNTTI